MAVIYPMSLGLLEGVTQLTMKALVAMVFACGWPFPEICWLSVWLWAFAIVFCSVGVLTVIWLKIVYTRIETTTGLPIEYGTVHACSVLGGIVFYREFVFMNHVQLGAALVGLVIVMCGVAVSSWETLPLCLNRLVDCVQSCCACRCCRTASSEQLQEFLRESQKEKPLELTSVPPKQFMPADAAINGNI